MIELGIKCALAYLQVQATPLFSFEGISLFLIPNPTLNNNYCQQSVIMVCFQSCSACYTEKINTTTNTSLITIVVMETQTILIADITLAKTEETIHTS